MTKRTPQQNLRYRAIVSKLNISEEQRQELTLKYSNGRETSSANLTQREMHDLCFDLERTIQPKDTTGMTSKQRMVRKVFALCHELGWEHPNGKVNTKTLSHWLTTKTKEKFPEIDLYNEEQLQKIVTQLRKIKAQDNKKDVPA